MHQLPPMHSLMYPASRQILRVEPDARWLRTEVDSRASEPSESLDSQPTLRSASSSRDAGLAPDDLALKATALAGEVLNHWSKCQTSLPLSRRPQLLRSRCWLGPAYVCFSGCCPTNLLTPARSQAAAAARIEGKLKIHQAAHSGNAELINDHFVSDATRIHRRDDKSRTLIPLFSFENAPMNPLVCIVFGHVMPLHS
jgi:hypothetical protein